MEGYSIFVKPIHYGLPACNPNTLLTPNDRWSNVGYTGRYILCFPLGVDVDKSKICKSLERGLAHTIAGFPFIGGCLDVVSLSDVYSPEAPPLQIVGDESVVELRFRDLSDILPSFKSLSASRFACNQFPSSRLMPVSVVPERLPAPVFVGQVNFIKGGLLLSVARHHAACDGEGLAMIMSTWAQNTALCDSIKDGYLGVHNPSACDRTRFMTGPDGATLAEFPEYTLSVGAGLRPTPPKDTIFNIFKFAPDSLRELKTLAAAYSTIDALSALLWRHLALARNPEGAHLPDTTSVIATAINGRGRVVPPATNYAGTFSFANTTLPLPLRLLLSDDSAKALHSAAGSIRASLIKWQDPERIPRLLGLMSKSANPREYKLTYDLEFGCAITSLAGFTSYYTTSWGTELGCPEKVRYPAEALASFTTILPGLPDGSLEVHLGLQKDVMERLIENQEFRRFAELES